MLILSGVDRWTTCFSDMGREEEKPDLSVRASPGAMVDEACLVSCMVRHMVSGGPPSEGLFLSFLVCPPDLFFVHVTVLLWFS